VLTAKGSAVGGRLRGRLRARRWLPDVQQIRDISRIRSLFKCPSAPVRRKHSHGGIKICRK